MVLPCASECLTEEVLEAWVSGRLGAAELPRVEAHVGGCTACLHRVGGAARQERASALDGLDVMGLEAQALFTQPSLSAPAVGGFPALLADRYEVIELVAQGGMGEVYRGFDRHTGAAVAVKRLNAAPGAAHAELLARFEREAAILRRLDHPNIVKMLAVVEGSEEHSIVMEYVAGGSLRRELSRRAALPQVEALLLALEVADALSAAHRSNVIHRDIKPENVLIDADGAVKLADFGLARMGEASFTAPGTVLGTVAYLSPDVLEGKEVDARTDLWSLGVMLFEMLSGVRPFVASTPGATLSAILSEPVPSLAEHCPAAPAELVELTARLLQKERERRVGSAEEVVRAIETILEGR